jgi:hypothetical protein
MMLPVELVLEERVMKKNKFPEAFYRVGLNLIAIIILSQAAVAQKWIQQSPTGTPPAPRFTAKYAYDAANDRLMVVGGSVGSLPYLGDVWVLTNATSSSGIPEWLQLTPTGSPPTNSGEATAVYDPNSNRLITHGGCSANCSPALSQTFVLTNANGLGGTPAWIALEFVSKVVEMNIRIHVLEPRSLRI